MDVYDGGTSVYGGGVRDRYVGLSHRTGLRAGNLRTQLRDLLQVFLIPVKNCSI